MRTEENERLTRVGPGTPAGEYFRRYWQPALLSEELPENDCPQLRVRLLGEDLVAFRDTSGRVGLVDAYCPHRRAPMFFGRNEECGLRCVYHGWKFNADGDCVDMPSEPVDTPLREKVKIKAYPTFEQAGVVWAYLGPKDKVPPKPNYEWMRAPPTHQYISKTFEACNYLQALEGGLDTAHSSFVHNNKINDKTLLRNRDRAPRIGVERTDYGYWYTSTRTVDENTNYIRVYHYVMPAQQMRGGITSISGKREVVPKLDGHIWVPIDDENVWVYNWAYSYDRDIPLTAEFINEWETFAGRGPDDLIPGTYKLRRNQSNDYEIDRELQRTQTYTGITGLNTQDFALQEGMGPIVDRSLEFLGSSDRAILTMRRVLRSAIDAVEGGDATPGVAPDLTANVRGHDGLLGPTDQWSEAFKEEMRPIW